MTSHSRRDILKKTLAVGTAAYVAPMIVGQVTTVHAQTVSGSVCNTLDNCETFSCGGEDTCACVPTVGGPTVCVQPSCVAPCATTQDCPPLSVCIQINCCEDATYCAPLCSAPIVQGAQAVAPWTRR
jgi:hypothetical protein